MEGGDDLVEVGEVVVDVAAGHWSPFHAQKSPLQWLSVMSVMSTGGLVSLCFK